MQVDEFPYYVPISDEAREKGRPNIGRFHNKIDLKW